MTDEVKLANERCDKLQMFFLTNLFMTPLDACGVCMLFVTRVMKALPEEKQEKFAKDMAKIPLEEAGLEVE